MSDATRCFDEQCVRSRVAELTERFISEWALEDMRQMAKAQRLKGDVVTEYPLNQAQIMEKFGEKAHAKALEILEQDRKNVVDEKSPYITIVLKNCIRQLRNLVFASDGQKKKIFIEKVPVIGAIHPNNPTMRDVAFIGDHDFSTYDAIGKLAVRFSEFAQYAPYFSKELSALWKETNELYSLEIVELKDSAKEKETETTAKTEAETA